MALRRNRVFAQQVGAHGMNRQAVVRRAGVDVLYRLAGHVHTHGGNPPRTQVQRIQPAGQVQHRGGRACDLEDARIHPVHAPDRQALLCGGMAGQRTLQIDIVAAACRPDEHVLHAGCGFSPRQKRAGQTVQLFAGGLLRVPGLLILLTAFGVDAAHRVRAHALVVLRMQQLFQHRIIHREAAPSAFRRSAGCGRWPGAWRWGRPS